MSVSPQISGLTRFRAGGLAIAVSLMCGTVAAIAAETATDTQGKTLLSDLKPGAVFRTTQKVDVSIPPLLKGMNNPSGILIEMGKLAPFFMATSDATCLVEDSALEFKDPDSFKLPEGAQFVVKSVELDKQKSSLYVGPATRLTVQAAPSVGMHLMVKLACYPGAPGTQPITVGVFEKLFSQKIALGAKKTP
jgi:hypothetical protein